MNLEHDALAPRRSLLLEQIEHALLEGFALGFRSIDTHRMQLVQRGLRGQWSDLHGFAEIGDGMFAIGYGIPPNGPLRAIRRAATPLADEITAHLGLGLTSSVARRTNTHITGSHITAGQRS